MAKDTFYFSHDYNCRSDEKIKMLLAKHGVSGYGVFWAIVEDLYNNANALRMDYVSIAYELHADMDLVKSVINDFDLFEISGDTFSSASIRNRLNERNIKSLKAKESAEIRWSKSKSDANALRTQSDSNAIKERKGKDNKGNDIKGKEKEFIPPTIFEVIDYFKENGYTKNYAEKAFTYYDTANWKDSKGNPVKNWKQKMIANWFKEENKIPVPGKTPMVY